MEILKFTNIFIISIILTIVFNINDQTLVTFGQYVPEPRYASSSGIIGNRLYIIGGQVSSPGAYYRTSETSREVIYLDLSKNFNSNSPPWVDYSSKSPLPVLNSWADSCQDKNNKIYVFGGIIEDPNTNSSITDNNKQIYVFDSVKNTWTTPLVSGTSAPATRREMKVVMDDVGKMYVFGGVSDPATGSNFTTLYNDMSIFDSNQLSWVTVNTLNPPTKRVDFTATYLPKNKLIVYIGGVEEIIYEYADTVDIKEISIFDTVSLTWSTKIVGGATIDDRRGHSAVLTSDYRIICYGGVTYNKTSSNPQLVVLDVSTNNYQWIAPINSTVNQPPSLIYHNAALYQNTMIVAFGNMTQSGGIVNKDVFLFDTKTYKWIMNFQATSSTNISISTKIIITISVVGSSVVIIMGIVVIFLISKYGRNNQNNHPNYPNNYENNPSDQNTM